MAQRNQPAKSEQRRPGGGGPRGGPPGLRPVEKAENFSASLKRLLKYLRPYIIILSLVFSATIAATILSNLTPRLQGNMITSLFATFTAKLAGQSATVDFDLIYATLLRMLTIYIVAAGLRYFQNFVMAGVTVKIVRRLRSDINAKLEKLPLKFYDGTSHGDILSKAVNDVDNISNTLSQNVSQMITSIVTLVNVSILMLILSWQLTLVTLLVLPVFMFITTPLIRRSQKYFKAYQESLGDLNGHIEETLSGINVVKAYSGEERALREFKEVNERMQKSNLAAQIISGLINPLMIFVGNLNYVGISVMGGYLAALGTLNVGDVTAFLSYTRLFMQPINQIANITNTVQSAVASAERIFKLLDEQEEIPDTSSPKMIDAGAGNVTFEGVDFSYIKDKELITGLDLEARKGQTIAIVGPTGAGKTTIVNLLMRFYDIDGGTVEIEGIDIRDMTRKNLRSVLGMVLQDTWLFNGTIMENIRYGNLSATDEQVMMAASSARADHFIKALPEGYDTVINEEGTNISSGQKQLITIARAILHDSPILILDEATSNVDTMTEQRIQTAMNNIMQGRTSFVIAHRLSTIKNADLILVMNEGRIIEKGRHDELLEQKGFYAELYNSQFTLNGNGATA